MSSPKAASCSAVRKSSESKSQARQLAQNETPQKESNVSDLDDSDGVEEDQPEESQSSETNNLLDLCPEWPKSLVEYYGPNSSYCGYCKKKDRHSTGGRRSYDLQSYRLTVSDYQDLLDRGWRRSGKYCYCPVNKTTCCPNFPIKCKTTEFKLTSSQRRCIENLNSYLLTGNHKNRVKLNYGNAEDVEGEPTSGVGQGPPPRVEMNFDELKRSSKARARRFVGSCERKVRLYNISIQEAMNRIYAKQLAKQPKILPLESYLFPTKSSSTGSKLTNVNFNAPKHLLKIKMCHVESKFSKESRKDEHEIMVKYQKAVHGEEKREWTMSRYCDFLVSSPLITEPLKNYDYLSSIDSNSSVNIGENLAKNANTRTDYLLVEPPDLPTVFGTYHCVYYLDDRMIAVGVLDVLPSYITTVYFFYDPEFTFLNLGIYSALIEISMVRQMSKHYIIGDDSASQGENKLIHYHMGYYVHECKKMRYKTRFRPSYLLCSQTLRYVPTEICLQKLIGRKYAPFSDEPIDPALLTATTTLERLLEIPVTSEVTPNDRKLTHYLRWLEQNLGDEYVDLCVNGYLVPYAQLVGTKLMSRLCLRVSAVHRTLRERHQRLARRTELSAAIRTI